MFSVLLAMATATSSASGSLADDPLVTSYHIERLETLPDGSLSEGGTWLWKWRERIKLEQLPAAIRDRPSKGRAILRLSIDAAGHLTACNPATPEFPDVTKAACKLVAATGDLPITYTAPGRPVAEQWTVALVWETQTTSDARRAQEARLLPPAPPAPPMFDHGKWPPLYLPRALVIASLPDLADVIPKPGHGTVGVVAKPVVDREQPDCEVRLSSGRQALDDAACLFVRSVRLRYKEPCADCSSDWAYPLLFEFDGSRSRVRLPRDDLGYRFLTARLIAMEPSRSDISALQKSPRSNSHVSVHGRIAADGTVTECRLFRSAGSPEADDAICTMFRHQRFEPPLDAFGDPMASEFHVPLDLSQL